MISPAESFEVVEYDYVRDEKIEYAITTNHLSAVSLTTGATGSFNPVIVLYIKISPPDSFVVKNQFAKEFAPGEVVSQTRVLEVINSSTTGDLEPVYFKGR